MAKVITPRTNIVRSFNSSHQQPQRAPISLEPAPSVSSERSERILLLEDEAQTNFILREYLESLGYAVVAVANGVDGLREVIKTDFELVICDMMMPKLPGDMFYLAVQKTRPQLCNRFVFITGHQQNPKIDAFIERTHSAILVKPFRLQQLEVTLEGILSRFPKKIRPVEMSAPVEEAAPSQPALRISLPASVESTNSTPAAPAKAAGSTFSKIVGLIRGSAAAEPASPPTAPQQPPKITLRVPPDTRKITRRIAHLANAPIAAPSSGSINLTSKTPPAGNPVAARVTRRVAPPSVAPPTGVIDEQKPIALTSRVTRKIAPPAELAKTAEKETAKVTRLATTARVTRVVPKADNLIRVNHSDVPTSSAEKPKARVTRKMTAPAPIPAPKTTRNLPKVTVRVPKTTAKIAPARTIPAPKVTAKVTAKVSRTVPQKALPKVTAKVLPKVTARVLPKVTARVLPKVTARVVPKVTAKVTAKIAPKVSRKIEPPAPVVTRRVANPKSDLRK